MRRSRAQSPPTGRDPFAPIETVVDAMLFLFLFAVGAGLVLVGVQAVSGHGSFSLFSFSDTVCVSAPAGQIGISGDDAPRFPKSSARGSTSTRDYGVCLTHASVTEQVAASADGVLSFVGVVGAGLLVRRTIRTARSVGLFTDDAARATRRLGWFLVVMSVASPLGAKTGAGVVVAAAIPGQHWSSQLTSGLFPLSVTVLLTGLGVLSFARILRLAVPLQEEAALTV